MVAIFIKERQLTKCVESLKKFFKIWFLVDFSLCSDFLRYYVYLPTILTILIISFLNINQNVIVNNKKHQNS